MHRTDTRTHSGRETPSIDNEIAAASSADSLNAVGHVSAVVEFLRDKARIAKRTGNICVVGTFLVGATILMTFLAFSQISAQQKASRDTDMLEISYR